jgi:hypothetical protein
MPERTLSSRLGQLALALVNATLVLAVLLVFGLWLLLGRAQGFAADTARAAASAIGIDLEAQKDQASATLSRLATVEARLTDAATRAAAGDSAAQTELAALRGEVRALTEAVGRLDATAAALRDQGSAALAGMLRQALLTLAAAPVPTPDPALSPVPPAN